MNSESAATAVPPTGSTSTRCKVRLRFGKGYDLRLLSHHDLLRAFERLLRRADLAIAHSQGFNPHPRIVFALSLPLGVIGLEEVVEIELNHPYDLDELRQRIERKAVPGLTLSDLRSVSLKGTAQVARLVYRIAVEDSRLDALRLAIPELLARAECPVERARTPGQRVDLRPSLYDLRLVEIADASTFPALAGANRSAWHYALEMELTPAPAGTARPEEVFALLGQPDLAEMGSVLERTRLVLVDECPPETPERTTWQKSC